MTFVFGDNAAVPPERLEAAFVIECARRGILTNGNILPSLAHDGEAVQLTGEAFEQALKPVRKLIQSGQEAVAQAVAKGLAHTAGPGPAGALPAAFFDAARDDGQRLLFSGWMLSEEGKACTVDILGPRGHVYRADPVERPDVAAAWPDAPGAGRAGFRAILSAEHFVDDGRYSFVVRGRCGDQVVFVCPVTRPRARDNTLRLEPARLGNDGALHL